MDFELYAKHLKGQHALAKQAGAKAADELALRRATKDADFFRRALKELNGWRRTQGKAKR
jgi:hypothetical protein